MRGVVVFGGLTVVRVDELVEFDALVDEVLGAEDVPFGSVYVFAEVRFEDEYDDVLLELDPDVLRVPVVRVEVPSARALRSFLILCTFTPARVASTGAAKILTTEAQSIAKKQAPREGLQPSIR